ncbi:CBS domain-containing protein CBSX5-like [Quillaja saponaria]|uniref:CBS domain-containing protein CBSX5-like n=1 Tax=Quillaja saponaria TaxID=32244 RepID=A0AAD7PAP0_QUISA|nr:CBS domain-containing protein CBSX5-like [Quillaja saponaria]
MAVSLLTHEVSDLCLGKPALRSLSISTTVADALAALKTSEDNFISVWDCDHSAKIGFSEENRDLGNCRCVGKLCMVDVICYLCKEENLLSPSDALKAPVSTILPKIPGLVIHLEPSSSLLEAIDLILQGAQNLVVPISTKQSNFARRKQNQKSSTTTVHNGWEFCWLTQEDVMRFLLSSIGLFSPIPALSIDTLGIISSDVLAIDYFSPASAAVGAITSSLTQQTSVAIVDSDGILIGEISPFTLACCDETVAAAITALSAGDLMAYIDCGGPPEDLVRVVKARLKEKNLERMLEDFTILSSLVTDPSFPSISSSSDEESALSPTTTLARAGRYTRSSSYSARMVRRAEAIVCHPKSSLVAVLIQAIAHRVNYVWVIEDDCSLLGIVTFSNMLKVFREHLETMLLED